MSAAQDGGVRGRVYCADGLEVAATLEDGSVDLLEAGDMAQPGIRTRADYPYANVFRHRSP